MDAALCIGGTRFIGRHTVEDLQEHGYHVTTLTRGEHDNPFLDREGVDHVRGDRSERASLEKAKRVADPDVVIDLCAYYPADVEAATEVFADVDAYVYVSSGSAYAARDVPLREDETPLHECTEAEATDDSEESYGPRKAEGDRVVFRAAEDGVNARVVRPMLVYGPYDYSERFAYWVHRVAEYDEIAVPHDGDSLLHRSYVEDVASALRIVAERGESGEAYNVADRNAMALQPTLEAVADVLGTRVSITNAGERDLVFHRVEAGDFPLYVPTPALASTEKLHDLGWESTDPREALERTVASHRERGLTGDENGPDRGVEEDIIDALAIRD